jgi:2-iminobutanoate/2-iminopropanoate deaminase
VQKRNAINAKGAAAVGPYSHAVEANGLLFLSGQTPLDSATGKLAEGNIGSQTKQCFANLGAVLAAAGLTFDDVITCQVYLTSMADFPAMNEEYAKHFSAPYPSRTTIGVASLPLGAHVEIGMTAKMRT